MLEEELESMFPTYGAWICIQISLATSILVINGCFLLLPAPKHKPFYHGLTLVIMLHVA